MVQEQNTSAFAQMLQSLWSIEAILVEALPRMMQKAKNFGLQKALALHLAETDQHKVAIEAICNQLGIDAQGAEPHRELQQLLQHGQQEMLNADSDSAVDAAIITSAQEIEKLEISAYAAAGEEAKLLGFKGIAGRLYLTMEEERQAETKMMFFEKTLFGKRADIGQKPVLQTH